MFLKILEYYEGILLLTTNRVKSIDIAVESRINLAVHFGPMSKADQRRLFKIFLNRLNERDIESKEDLETFGDKYFKEVCRFDSVIATDWLGIQRQRHSQSVFVGACHRASGEHQAPETAHRHCAGVQEERAEDVCGAENDCTDGEGVRIGGVCDGLRQGSAQGLTAGCSASPQQANEFRHSGSEFWGTIDSQLQHVPHTPCGCRMFEAAL